ncbi:uncharacterized protein LOC126958565 [Macaca thibetana thibetana]|uniref:uncharacterized protein LOC126958565 n=1 Tax=Macaca thibetana thibetana TaxID=257877 RepID=UPI0021BCA798|nr:uncharacterized protein LOC126958565 [Macaca thibetana thibetana]
MASRKQLRKPQAVAAGGGASAGTNARVQECTRRPKTQLEGGQEGLLLWKGPWSPVWRAGGTPGTQERSYGAVASSCSCTGAEPANFQGWGCCAGQGLHREQTDLSPPEGRHTRVKGHAVGLKAETASGLGSHSGALLSPLALTLSPGRHGPHSRPSGERCQDSEWRHFIRMFLTLIQALWPGKSHLCRGIPGRGDSGSGWLEQESRAGAEGGERRLASQSHREDGGVGGREEAEDRDWADSGG